MQLVASAFPRRARAGCAPSARGPPHPQAARAIVDFEANGEPVDAAAVEADDAADGGEEAGAEEVEAEAAEAAKEGGEVLTIEVDVLPPGSPPEEHAAARHSVSCVRSTASGRCLPDPRAAAGEASCAVGCACMGDMGEGPQRGGSVRQMLAIHLHGILHGMDSPRRFLGPTRRRRR